jgi:hypothetical protein
MPDLNLPTNPSVPPDQTAAYYYGLLTENRKLARDQVKFEFRYAKKQHKAATKMLERAYVHMLKARNLILSAKRIVKHNP